ncbi:MAG: alpha-glucan family phosphorylase [Chloroflexi bacterium]|nr:MAG: alpha-glucan family phosphorylase [Chloroflexota bacterium]
MPAHLLGRPRRAGGRPPEGDERPRPPARRRRPPLQAGLRPAGHRPGWTPVRGVLREPRLGPPRQQGRGGRGRSADRSAQRAHRGVAGAGRPRPAVPPRHRSRGQPAGPARHHRPPVRAGARPPPAPGDRARHRRRAGAPRPGTRLRRLPPQRRTQLPVRARAHPRAASLAPDDARRGAAGFDAGLVWDLLGPYLAQVGISFDRFMDLGRQRPGDPRERFCTTYAALRLADQSVGVSRLHGAVSRRIWKDAWRGLPEAQVPIGSVTNGVHMPTWVAPEIAALLSRYVGPDWWDLDPADGRWHAVHEIAAAELWEIHGQLKRRLLELVKERAETPHEVDMNALTIGFGRRFAPYKRANLLLRDRPRLTKLLRNSRRPVQILFAGKSHPADQPGKDIVAGIVGLAREEPRVIFLKDYDITLARHLVQGADIWLNNPRRFLEASGTSGMKAGANGGLNVSVLDGWWDEAYRPELGWAIPSAATLDRQDVDDLAEAEGLYRLLEREVVPAFYDRDENGIPLRWVEMMKASIRHVVTQFAARRMVIDYFNAAYGPGARRVEQLRLLPDWGG